MRDTSVDFPSSTLSSKDSGVSTLSNKKSNNSYDLESPEMREKTGPSPPRPITIATSFPCVTSAPNLLSASVLDHQATAPPPPPSGQKVNKPRMPEPDYPGEEECHVARIHVSSPAVPPAVINSVYMNIPKHPEYVNFADTKHQYVNVSAESQSSHRRKTLLIFLTLGTVITDQDASRFIFHCLYFDSLIFQSRCQSLELPNPPP